MSKIFLHVGMHKTGSTAIQSTFSGFDNGKIRYADLGYENHSIPFYTAYSGKHQSYHIWKSARLSVEEIEYKRLACREIIQDCVSKAADKHLIFSGEDISLLPQSALKEISDLFKHYDRKVKVIFYVREPISFIQSNYQEEIKSGRNFSSPVPPMYRFRIEKFLNIFGADNVIFRVFDRNLLYKNDIIKDFSQLIGVVAPPKGQSDNASLSTEAVKVVYLLNQLVLNFDEKKGLLKARQRMLEHVRTLLPGPFGIPVSLLAGIVVQEDVEWLLSETGIDFRITDYNIEPFSEESLSTYLGGLEKQTLDAVKDYLSQSCGLSWVPDNKHFLLARYFMSFMSTGWLSGFKFDPDRYLELNPDVKVAGVDPYRHYLEHGLAAGRRVT